MATHRSHDKGLTPDFEFQIAMDVLEVSEDLAARRRPITPDTLARQLCARSSGPRPTITQIQDALVQVQHWREQILSRDLLDHRRQLVGLATQLRTQQRQLAEVQFYLDKMLGETNNLLQNSLAAPTGTEPPVVRPDRRRALQ